jgi:hypothetical protein
LLFDLVAPCRAGSPEAIAFEATRAAASAAAAAAAAPAPAPAPAAAAASSAGLPEGWVATADPSSGRTYYVHLPTQTTQWHPPTDAAAAAPTPAPAAAAGLSLTPAIKVQWSAILSYARQEASAKAGAKMQKFQGLRNFAAVAAKKKAEVAVQKAAVQAADAAVKKAHDDAAARLNKSILSLLDLPMPTVPAAPLPIEDYAEEHFELNRKGLFHKKTTVAKVLAWKDDTIGKALLKMPTKELETLAIQCFRNVTGFMGDRSSTKEEGGHAEKLLKTCLHSPVELRDEVFCQIIKQTTNNPSASSTLKGWMLLGIIAGAIAPSHDFEPYLYSFIDRHRSVPNIGDYASYAMARVAKTVSLGPRREVPTQIEIDACRCRLPVIIRVYHLDGTFDALPVTSWVTPAILKQMVCDKRGILESEAFALFEMTPDNEERLLEPDERVLDLVAYWQRLSEEEKARGEDAASKKTRKKATGNHFYRVVFKVRMYFEPPVHDIAAQHEMYVQATFDVVSARYPCSERDCASLAAIQLQAECGDAGMAVADLQAKLTHFMPLKYAENTVNNRLELLSKEIVRQHGEKKGMTRKAAEEAYLAYVKSWQVYGSSFFFVEPQMSMALPTEVFLAVNPRGVLIINPDTKAVLASHPYSEVPTWGHSGSSFVLHIGSLLKQTKMYFLSDQGKEINDLVRAYVNHMCAAATAAKK